MQMTEVGFRVDVDMDVPVSMVILIMAYNL